MEDQTKFDKIQLSLFDESALEKLTPKELELRNRYQNIFTVWHENPFWSDKDMVRYIRQELGLGKTQAYQDLSKVKMILGNVNNAAKEWQRYAVIEMAKETYNLAKKRGDLKAMAMALDKLGKYTRLDQNDVDLIPWDQIIPPEFENTDDVEVLKIIRPAGFEEKVNKLKKKYLGEDLNIEEANVIE
jgi:hypothetical protein